MYKFNVLVANLIANAASVTLTHPFRAERVGSFECFRRHNTSRRGLCIMGALLSSALKIAFDDCPKSKSACYSRSWTSHTPRVVTDIPWCISICDDVLVFHPLVVVVSLSLAWHRICLRTCIITHLNRSGQSILMHSGTSSTSSTRSTSSTSSTSNQQSDHHSIHILQYFVIFTHSTPVLYLLKVQLRIRRWAGCSIKSNLAETEEKSPSCPLLALVFHRRRRHQLRIHWNLRL